MISQSNSLKIKVLIILCVVGLLVKGQKLIQSRQTSYFTYVYKLTDKEANAIFKKNIWVVDTSYFHTLVDSFPTDSKYLGKLSAGYYLKTYAERNKQKLFVLSVPDFDVKILNNNTDLCIQVYDLKGSLIPDATVKVGMKNLRFDKKMQSYVDRKSNQRGLLKVSHHGNTTYYQLSRRYNNSGFKRAKRIIIYGTPLNYIWRPINYIIYLPIDGVKSIVKKWPQGTIYQTKNFFIKTWKKIACFFDPYNCDSYPNNKFQRKHTGYLVFNKPRYLPGDTVKFKAFLVTKKGIPINKTVIVTLDNYKKTIKLATLNPYRKGGYEYQFFLHDSLHLQLDRRYRISLEFNDDKEYISGSFEYEDYELSKNKLEIRVETNKQYKGKPFKVFAKGIDENNLNLLDARLEILVKPKETNKYFDEQVFIPDTLFFSKKSLVPTNETEIAIPDSVFPKANLSYDLRVRLLNSDNEAITEGKTIEYFHFIRDFDISLKSDSVQFIYRENGDPKSKNVQISATDNFGNVTDLLNSTTPCKLLLNPYFREYTIKSDSLKQRIDIWSEPSLLNCLSERTKDSISIVVDNPRKLPFTYNIYKKNIEQRRGYTDSLSINKVTPGKQNYFVSIRYLWGGKIKEENYRIPFVDKELNLSVTQPKIIYPGQKTKIEIKVTDKTGKPVPGVDLTAYALTKKFNYSAPRLPYLGDERKNKVVINNFNLNDAKSGTHTGLNLNYKEWKLLAGLDSIEYYKFIYPRNNFYRFEYIPDDNLTQFSPFVVSDGVLQPIQVIYIDNKPTYFSWSTNTQPYSFRIDSGYHQIRLRTNYRIITLDSLYFNRGKKLVFSLNTNLIQKNIKIEKTEPELNIFEKRLLYKYIFPYRNTFGERYAYIVQGDMLQFLKPSGKNTKATNFAGPVSGNVTFNLLDSLSINFDHEPFFEYEFNPGLLKMRTINEKENYQQKLLNVDSEQGLSDLIFTKEKLKKQWQINLDNQRYLKARYKYPAYTLAGAGKLQINFSNQNGLKTDDPLNILVFRYDNHQFLRVYSGNTSVIQQLDKGLHKLIFFYSGAKYFIADSINIQPNGLNYYQVQKPLSLRKDTFSVYVSNLIEETIFKQVPYTKDEEKELKQIYNMYQQQFRYTGDGNTIDGFVYEEGSGDPIPGASVIIKGTTYGTITDLKGHYSLNVPQSNAVLQFLFVGFKSQEINVGYNSNINVRLEPEELALEEVVVVGYGFQKKSDLTGSVVTVSSNSLLGGIPGVSSNIPQALQGKAGGVQIISNNGEPGSAVSIQIRGVGTTDFAKKPLYIINGNVYTGDISDLNPDLIENIQILKDADSTAIYGAMGANGVVIITTKGGSFQPAGDKNIKGADYDKTFFETASKSSSIRENFSDYAFWKPRLTSDKEGKASFEVTFPDDVTSWQTFYLAMNDKRQTGQTESMIKSYKPLMAQLAVPRFLVQTDTTYVIGKVRNYSPDSVDVTTNFEINNKSVFSRKQICTNSILDTLVVIAPNDSISLKYFIKKSDGYFDGEQKKIPVYPIGLEETKGNFVVMQKDTTFEMSFDAALGKVNLYASQGFIDVVDDEINHLINYKYLCNEQIASKLKAFLAKKLIAKYKGKEFKDDRDIEKLINLLQQNQKENSLWGWWKDSDISYWISLHVIEALMQAKLMGFIVRFNETQIAGSLIWELESNKDFTTKLQILKSLRLFNSQINYKVYIDDLERMKMLSLNNRLQLLELKLLCKLDGKVDTLKSFQKETFFGNIYFSDDKANMNLTDNDIQNTILAYKILKNDSLKNRVILEKIRNYFMEKRRSGYWQNTYESSQIIETILPDIMGNKPQLQKSSLRILGDVTKTVTEFPFESVSNPIRKISISKTGDYPVYLTAYQHFWNFNPQIKNSDLIITTSFDNAKSLMLIAGKTAKLTVNLEVKKDADYLMINIPVPGGCSYADKSNNFKNEVHREYYKNETAIFCEKLARGIYTFEIDLIPRYSGKYTLNPAKVELMYFPTFNANNELKKVTIN